MTQRRLAGLLGISPSALSKSLRGLRLGGIPRYIRFAILCWKVMTPEQRRQVERELDASDDRPPEGEP